jgi:hypothetical protein
MPTGYKDYPLDAGMAKNSLCHAFCGARQKALDETRIIVRISGIGWRPSLSSVYRKRVNEPDSYGSESRPAPIFRTGSGYKSKRSPPSATNRQLASSFFSVGPWRKPGAPGSPHAPRAIGSGVIGRLPHKEKRPPHLLRRPSSYGDVAERSNAPVS